MYILHFEATFYLLEFYGVLDEYESSNDYGTGNTYPEVGTLQSFTSTNFQGLTEWQIYLLDIQ